MHVPEIELDFILWTQWIRMCVRACLPVICDGSEPHVNEREWNPSQRREVARSRGRALFLLFSHVFLSLVLSSLFSLLSSLFPLLFSLLFSPPPAPVLLVRVKLEHSRAHSPSSGWFALLRYFCLVIYGETTSPCRAPMTEKYVYLYLCTITYEMLPIILRF